MESVSIDYLQVDQWNQYSRLAVKGNATLHSNFFQYETICRRMATLINYFLFLFLLPHTEVSAMANLHTQNHFQLWHEIRKKRQVTPAS